MATRTTTISQIVNMFVVLGSENKMVEFRDIYCAYIKCRKLKRNTANALVYELNLIENICNLETSLNNYTYTPKRSVCFLTRSPKLREVFAADFSDRVVHHLIVPILEEIYEPKFIHDSYSNRKNRGIHSATKRALHFCRGSNYYLQLDIKNFFYTINKDILFYKLKSELLKSYKKVKNTKIELNQMLWILNKIIYHDVTKNVIFKGNKYAIKNIPSHKTLFKIPKSRGLPIGNLTSQFFANVYMDGFDNFVKRELKVKRYIRYVDDFVLFADTKEKLLEYYGEIVEYLKNRLGLTLRDNYILKQNHQGLDFLGYIIRPYYILSRKRVLNNYKQKKAKYLQRYESMQGKMDLAEIKQFLAVHASFLGHIKHSNSYNLHKNIGAINENNPFDYDRT